MLVALVSCWHKPNETTVNSKTTWTGDQLLDTVQYQTFRYFWDGAEPNSGMACERIHIDGHYPKNDANVVTLGGSGFGVMAILVGIERGFITRQEALVRYQKIVNFLKQADRFHGAWPYWLDGETGKVAPFSEKDNGGDLVETYLIDDIRFIENTFPVVTGPCEGTQKDINIISDFECQQN